jgi:hypothetical protein
MYKKTAIIFTAGIAAVLVAGLTATSVGQVFAQQHNQGTTNVAVGGNGGIGGAGGAGGTAIGGNGDCKEKCSGGDASANGGHGGNANGGNAFVINGKQHHS